MLPGVWDFNFYGSWRIVKSIMMRRILVVLGYALGATVIIIGTILLIAFGNGYSYDFKTGRLVHRGLLLLETKPSGAAITINGKYIGKDTPFRRSYEGGMYDIKVERDGYRTWNKQVEIIPSRVTATQYIMLMPNRFESEEVARFSALEQFTPTRDRSRIAFVVPGVAGDSGLWVMNAGNQDRRKLYSLPAPTEGQPVGTLQIMSWSDDASHLLVRRTVNGVTSTLVVDARGNDQAIDITDVFKTDIADVTFSKNNWQELYWTSPEGLRRLSLSDQTISAVLVEKIGAYTYAGDRIIYIDTSTKEPSLWWMDRGGRKELISGGIPPSSRYGVAYSTYIDRPYAVVTSLDSGKVQLFNDIYSDNMTGRTLEVSAHTATFNGDGRFVALGNDNATTVFDLELTKLYSLNNSKPISGLSWYDNYHLQYYQDGQAVVAEYDGNYATGINRSIGQPPINAPNNRQAYVVNQASNNTVQIRLVTVRR